QLDLAVRRVLVDGEWRSMSADMPPIVAGSQRARKIGAIALGTAGGALLGHSVAKDKHGTLIGGLVGGAATYGLTRPAFRTMQLRPGTELSFTTNNSVAMRREIRGRQSNRKRARPMRGGGFPVFRPLLERGGRARTGLAVA